MSKAYDTIHDQLLKYVISFTNAIVLELCIHVYHFLEIRLIF